MPARPDAAAHAKPHRLELAFADPKAFLDEYARNLVRGGAMIRSEHRFALREIVEVALEAAFAKGALRLRAEVVHASSGSVAVEFLEATPRLRELLEPLRAQAERLAPAPPPPTPSRVGPAPAADDDFSLALDEDELVLGLEGESFDLDDDPAKPAATPQGFETNAQAGTTDPNDRTFRARAERSNARVRAAVRGPTGKSLPAVTRDVSSTGMLLSVEGEELPVGREVQVSIHHPTSGEQLTVPAKVVRHLAGDGVVGAVAVELPASAQTQDLERFVSEVQRVDAQQRNAGIRGPLEELGGASLLQMFAALSQRGTLAMSHGVEEGIVVFEAGCLRHARIGSVTGTKALARMLSWRDGLFEFRAHVDPGDATEAGVPMEAAILDALRMLDEGQRLSGPLLPPAAKLVVERSQLSTTGPALGKTEQAVLELASAGFTVRRILDVIPENDAAIRAAISALIERGLVRLA